MKLPARIRERPLVSITVLVFLVLIALTVLANTFGPDRVAGWVEWGLGILEPLSTEGKPT